MTGDLCPGSGQKWTHDGRYETCPSCGTPAIDFNYEPTYEPVTVPQHTVDEATGEVWVQAVAPKPEPDPWAVALYHQQYGTCATFPSFAASSWHTWHRIAAEARRLAATDPAIRAAHWREFGKFLSGCGYVGAAREASHQAELVERGEA